MKLKKFLGTLVLVCATLRAPAQTVSTIITNGLVEPNSVAVDASDVYYLSSSANNQIVKYDPGTGLVTTLAGVANGVAGTNDSVGFLAQFTSPKGLVLARGGLVVADSGNHTLRFITLTGSIAQVTTLAGTPGLTGTNDGPAATASFNAPVGLAVDPTGNIYIADSKNNAIRKLDVANNVTTVVGSGLSGPSAVALDTAGLFYIADTRHHTIQTYNPGTGVLSLLAGMSNNPGTNDNFFASQAQFNSPNGLLWVGGNIGLLVSDSGNNAIRQVYYNTPITNYSVATYAGIPSQPGTADGALLSAQFNFPIGLATDTVGGLLVVDSGNHRLRRIQTTPPQVPVPNPEIGYVTFVTNSSTGSLVSQLVAVSNGIFFNDVTIAIIADTTAQTLFTSGATPGLFSTNTIPTPNSNLGIGSAPPPYSDGLASSAVPPTMVGTLPDLTIEAISTSSGRLPSAIVSARFQFKCGAPIILGDNPASFVLSNITAGAQMWYTTNGINPTNVASSTNFGPVLSGDTINLTLTSDVTFSVRAFKNNYQSSDISAKTLSPTNFLANDISFGFENGEASSDFLGAAGQTFVAPVTLTLLPGQQMFSLQFNLTVTNLNSSPVVTPGTMGFNSMLVKPVPGVSPTVYEPITNAMFTGPTSTNFTNLMFTNTTANLLGVGWLERAGATNLYDTTKQDLISFSQAHDTLFESKNGQVILGAYTFVIPSTATNGQSYQLQIGRPSATSDGVSQDVFIQAPTNGALAGGAINSVKVVTVTQPSYLVGDVSPFRWFNAGDFGDGFILNNDVLQVFQSAVYFANTPSPNSDLFDAMDSSNGSTNAALKASSGNDTNINGVAYGDGKLLVDDVFVTFRRSLDPNLTWYLRYWSGGVRVAVATNNVARNGGPDLPAEQVSKSLDDSPATAFSSDPSSVVFSADDFRVAPGQTVRVPIRAQVGGSLPVRVMALNLNVQPLDGSPPLTVPAQFTLVNALGPPTLTQSRHLANQAAAWLDNTVPGFTGSNVIGTVQFTVPTNATPDSAYRIQFEHASASPNGLWIFPQQVQPGLVALTDRTASSLGDGISDAWRLRYFASVSNPAAQANVDADGDGMSNAAEFLAGTDPTDRGSSLKFASVEKSPAQGVTVYWPSVTGKQYIVESSTSAGGGGWTAVSGNLSGSGQILSFTDNAQGSGGRFYRVRLGP
ncbi:MAG: chitobiase/beta-hexosaminidase C-terminal domain-containing protein [Limisphaerales bacterium]